ncbi:EpsG family protein [Acinetobacter baumannii]|nr:EpsG family protein [Acinetobacter baumannii]MBV6768625.1 EpsG family protein [Acinetobacter baumannii]
MKRYNVLNSVLFFINPFLGFFSSLYDLVRSKDSSLFFSLSLALICIYFPIMYDTSANFFSIDDARFVGISEPYLYIPFYLREKFGIDFYYFLFLNVVFVIYTWSKIALKFFSKTPSKYSAIYILVFVLLTFNYRDLMDINRSIFAYSLFFYYVFLIKNKNLLNFFFFSFFAVMFHNSSLIVIALYLLSNVKFGYRLNLMCLLSSLMIGVVLSNYIASFESLISKIPLFGSSISFYLYSEKFGVQVFTVGTLLKKILNCCLVVLSCLYAIFEIKKRGNDQILQLIIFVGCIELIFLGFVTFFERVNLAFNFVFLYLFVKEINFFQKISLAFLVAFRSLCLYIFIYFPIFFGDYSAVMVNNSYKNEMMLKPLYYPTFFLLDIHNNGYSDNFISANSIWRK